MVYSLIEILYKIGEFIDNYFRYVIIAMVIIALVVFYIIGSRRQKREKDALKEQEKQDEKHAPYTQKSFVQGQETKRQKLSINKKEDENNG